MSLGSDVTTYYGIKWNMSEEIYIRANLINIIHIIHVDKNGRKATCWADSISWFRTIIAALEPDETNYLYFVADKNGKTYFAETLSKHKQLFLI